MPRPTSAPTLLPSSIRLVLREIAEVHHLDRSCRVLVHRERVDHAHGVALAQALELGDDLAVELRMLEPEHDQLHRSDSHRSPFGRAATAIAGCWWSMWPRAPAFSCRRSRASTVDWMGGEAVANLTSPIPSRILRMG